MSYNPERNSDINFLLGTTPDGNVLVDFRMRPVDHLILTRDQALEMAEGLVDAVRQAADHGRIILPDDSPFRGT